MNFYDLLPYLGAGSGAAIPFLMWRLAYLEGLIKSVEKQSIKERNRNDMIYFYLAKEHTNFGNFLNKYNKRFE